MRLRAAIVKLQRANGLDRFFQVAEDRHLAFAIGTGYIYKDLAEVARQYGYEMKTFESNEDDVANYWVAVRTDIIAGTLPSDGLDNVTFETNVKGLGWVTVGTDSEEMSEDDNSLTFYTNDMETLVAYSQSDRVKVGSNLGPDDRDDFIYNEYLFLVKAIKS